MIKPPPRGLYVTLMVTLAVSVLLAAVLVRPGVHLMPLRTTTFELDEPAVPLPFPKTPARP